MQPAIVLGSARATIKHASLSGQRLVVIQPIGSDGTPDGPPLIAVDGLGCRKNDRVIATSDGSYAREVTQHQNTPARWSVVGIIDE
ncbi:EutN/CcmL family microcompartment protein [Novipirellula artificiosorum]|uniref:Ethanolamine utilization protein EutN n=1 Tax=Novipirellula artificiosorum TaxID=2528016 RepID=A0A5C6DWW5_9BACT|nr:EutN/CcmL family microcompartment protein [Novipirellula artificiosorum]TWU40885.1 Ethanolamine utilization protein EutN [Novipirellula artificiosorum]